MDYDEQSLESELTISDVSMTESLLRDMTDNVPDAEIVPRKVNEANIFFKLLVLLLICCCQIGLGFTNDNPSALQDVIMKNLNVSEFQYQLLLTFSAVPNILMAFISGIIVDYVIGLRKSIIVFTFVVTFGQGIFALGSYLGYFWLMVIGRFFFGCGAESVAVASNKFGAIWLTGPLLTIFFSLQQSFIKSNEFLNMFYMHEVYVLFAKLFPDSPRLSILALSFCVGFTLCLFSVLTATALALSDYIYRKKRNMDLNEDKEEKFKLSNIKDLSYPFWILCTICALFYSVSTTFNGLSVTFVQLRYMMTSDSASKIQSVYILTAIGLSPLFGFVVGFIGHEALFLVLSGIICLIGHILLNFTLLNPIYIFILNSFGFTLRNLIIWPMVSYLVPENRLGIAYGAMQSIQNLALTITPMIYGLLIESINVITYDAALIILIGLSLTGCVVLYLNDLLSGKRILELTTKQRVKKLTNTIDLDRVEL